MLHYTKYRHTCLCVCLHPWFQLNKVIVNLYTHLRLMVCLFIDVYRKTFNAIASCSSAFKRALTHLLPSTVRWLISLIANHLSVVYLPFFCHGYTKTYMLQEDAACCICANLPWNLYQTVWYGPIWGHVNSGFTATILGGETRAQSAPGETMMLCIGK